MKVSELQAGAKGITISGHIGYVGERKHITGEKNGKPYSFFTQFITVMDVKGTMFGVALEDDKVAVNLHDSPEITREQKDQPINLVDCTLEEYKDKKNMMQKSLQAKMVGIETKKSETVKPEPEKAGEMDLTKIWEVLNQAVIKLDKVLESLSQRETPITQKQIARIHILVKDKGLSDEQYRSNFLAKYRVLSSKDLSSHDAEYLIGDLETADASIPAKTEGVDSPSPDEKQEVAEKIQNALNVVVEFGTYKGQKLDVVWKDSKNLIRTWGSDKFQTEGQANREVVKEACKYLLFAKQEGLL